MFGLEGIDPVVVKVVKTIIILIVSFAISKIFSRYILKHAKKLRIEDKIVKPLQNILSFIVYLVALFFVLDTWGIRSSLTGLLASAGFAGIVIGFATKDIIGNLISGLILFFDRKFNVGDVVEVAGISGKVENISIRTTTIMTWDGELVVVPNSKIANEIIKNKSLYKPLIRLKLPIGIAYESDVEKVIKVCNEVMEKMEEIEKDPKPQVVFDRFGDSSINLELRFWINMKKVSSPSVKTKLSIELKKAFEKHGIKIPYPHIEIVRSSDNSYQ